MIVFFATIFFFFFFGLLCSEGEQAFCDKFTMEIMITGYCILGTLLIIGLTAHFRHRMPYEIFYAIHHVVFLMYSKFASICLCSLCPFVFATNHLYLLDSQLFHFCTISSYNNCSYTWYATTKRKQTTQPDFQMVFFYLIVLLLWSNCYAYEPSLSC